VESQNCVRKRLTTANVAVGSRCDDVTSCELARPGVRRGAAESNTCGCGNAVDPTSILRHKLAYFALERCPKLDFTVAL